MTGIPFYAVFAAVVLHAGFMLGELLKWSFPFLLGKLTDEETWSGSHKTFLVNIVHNAGIYNGIVASGLFWAAYAANNTGRDFAVVLLIGAVVAGIFGTVTLKNGLVAIQSLVAV